MPSAVAENAPSALFAALILIKLGFLAAIGPVFTPDSGDYIRFADLIIEGGEWTHRLDLGSELFPLTAFRAVGYPFFLALCKIFGGDAWSWLAVAMQMALSLFTTMRVYAFAQSLIARPLLALLAASGHAVAQTFYLDQCILTDSLNASLITLAALIAAKGILDQRPPGLRDAATIGGLLAVAFTLREAGVILQITLWPLIALWCVATRVGLRRTALVLAITVLPVFAGIQAYQSWNQMRTGERFITTAAQTAMFRPALDLYRRGLPVFKEDPLLGDAPELDGPAYDIPGNAFSRINLHLSQAHHMTSLSNARYAQSMYLRHWRDYPLERAKIALSKLNRSIAYMLIMPVVAPERLSLWSGGGTPLPTSKQLRHVILDEGRLDLAAALALRTLARTLSACAMAAFFLGIPIVIIRSFTTMGRRLFSTAPDVIVMGGLWVFALGYFAAYGLVHMEERYLLPVAPFVFVCGLTLIASSFQHARRHLKSRLRQGVPKGSHDA